MERLERVVGVSERFTTFRQPSIPMFESLGAKAVWSVVTRVAARLKRAWTNRNAPGSIHDGEDMEAFIKDLEAAGGNVINKPDPGEPIHVDFLGDGRDLVERASGDYRIADQLKSADTETKIALYPK